MNFIIKAKLSRVCLVSADQIRKLGDRPLREVLESLGGWPVTVRNWEPPPFPVETLLGRLRGEFNEGVLIEQWVGPDDKNSSVNILQVRTNGAVMILPHPFLADWSRRGEVVGCSLVVRNRPPQLRHAGRLDQMQLALPSRDYYLKASSEGDLKAYHKYMTEVALLLGANASTAAEELNKVIQFEKDLANASLPEADRHDTSAIYRKLKLSQLQVEVPQLNWLEYLNAFLDADITEDEPVVSYAMPYFSEMGRIIQRTDRRVIHNYVLWRMVMNIMPHMIDDYQQKRVEFRKILLGILSERNRWSQCVEWTNKKLGMAVGALFIRDNFNHESKVKPAVLFNTQETALEMIHTIREAFNELLAENHWMDDETRAVAKEKADAMNERIGYPELLTDPDELSKEYVMGVLKFRSAYTRAATALYNTSLHFKGTSPKQLNITEDQFLLNILNVLRYDAYHNLQKLRQPVNKDKWSTEPAVVNAFYNPNKNDIVFPAGILQPLFYSQHFPKSLNYGGIGVVIGHEITHGFDDKGRQFDKDGNMMQWWNNSTVRAFRERAQCIIEQYSLYKLDEVDLYVNGRMTQGENIADNGGLKQSFRAYKKWVRKHGEEPGLPGINLTHDQLFFLNYAQIWCGSMRPEDALTKIRSSVHSPGPIRVLGPLSNSHDFAQAYACPVGSPMNPTNKCTVW
uniref:(California timema) hypothetical protein n=1 Tax=Timema californicum TaxID=61474 RepID=A0A7R9P486_TIMCA|nr:unnamed protein product [Timema californicum]